jgi:DNA-directed RNA polymerase sigma subunit (sigma70/sigma32)
MAGSRGSRTNPPGDARGGGERARAKARPVRREEPEETAAQLVAPLRRVLERLPATQRKVLELRMGLADGHPHDVADTAAALGMSVGEVREVEARAFERIREVIPLQQLQKFLER